MSNFELRDLARPNPLHVDDSASLPPTSGERLSFTAIYQHCFRDVRHSVRRFGVPERHADDVTQDVFVAVHRSLPRFDWSRPLRPWLKTITYRAARDHLRIGKNSEQLAGVEDFNPVDASTEDHEGQLAERRDAVRTLDAVLQTLDHDDREVILLIEIDECRVMDVAVALGLPDSTVSTRLQRARKRFDAALARRRAVEDRRLGTAGVLPLFLLDPAALWDATREAADVSSAAQARIWGRLARATATATLGLTGALAARVMLTPTQLAARAVLAIAVGALGGGAVVYAALHRVETAEPVTASREIPALSAPQAQGSPSAITAPDPSVAVTAVPSPKSARDLDAGADVRVASDPGAAEREEMALIDSARNALRTRHAEEALTVLARHARKFPRGVYQEEREALRREALRTIAEQDAGR